MGEPPVETYPGLFRIADAWDTSPWTRVSFGLQWVVEPEGQYPLTIAIKNPAKFFGASLEKALEDFIEIRTHERGSPGEAAAIRRVQAELDQLADARMGNDPVERTREILNAAKGNLRERFPGVLEFPDPVVRRRAAELLGEYAEQERDPGFRPGGEWDFFGDAVARRLDDEDPEVRAAAAAAVFRFFGQAVPGQAPEQLIETARGMYAGGRAASAAPAGSR